MLVSRYYPEEATEIEDDVKRATVRLESTESSPSELDSWYRDELTPLLASAERVAHNALESSGREKYHPKGK